MKMRSRFHISLRHPASIMARGALLALVLLTPLLSPATPVLAEDVPG